MPLGGLVPEPPEPPLPAPPDPDPSGGVHDPFCQKSNQLLKQNKLMLIFRVRNQTFSFYFKYIILKLKFFDWLTIGSKFSAFRRCSSFLTTSESKYQGQNGQRSKRLKQHFLR